MILNLQDYRNKVLGCWMGKNIGGTLGAPMEWRRQVNNVSFYTQNLAGEPLPNDDLDIQLLWLVALEERGIDIDAQTLSEYWCLYVTPHWSEYGTAKVNMRSGLMPPLSGTMNNAYKDSCGAFIRSEIWACIAPGCPQIAARYAYEDAILDHGNGEGTYGEVFCAAMESAAFVMSDVYSLIDIGLSYIPEGCGVAGAVRCAVKCFRDGKPWLEARDAVLRDYRGSTFFGWAGHTSEADQKKGFHTGKRGWDVPSNIGMLVIGLLYGEGDFGKSICTAVNCGEDTDCTGATVGSIFGIMHGIGAIPERWIAPIGRKIKTACLNLGELGYFGNQLPQDVEAMTTRTERIARQVLLRYAPHVEFAERTPSANGGAKAEQLAAGWLRETLFANMNGPVSHFDFFDVAVDYGEEGAIVRDATAKAIRVTIRNTYKVQATLNLRWYVPDGWRVSPSPLGTVFSFPGHLSEPNTLEFRLEADRVPQTLNRFVMELTMDSRPSVMLVPIILQNANLAGRAAHVEAEGERR